MAVQARNGTLCRNTLYANRQLKFNLVPFLDVYPRVLSKLKYKKVHNFNHLPPRNAQEFSPYEIINANSIKPQVGLKALYLVSSQSLKDRHSSDVIF